MKCSCFILSFTSPESSWDHVGHTPNELLTFASLKGVLIMNAILVQVLDAQDSVTTPLTHSDRLVHAFRS